MKTKTSQIVIPHQVLSPKKDETMVVSNPPKSDDIFALVYMDYNDEIKDKSYREGVGCQDKNVEQTNLLEKMIPIVEQANLEKMIPVQDQRATRDVGDDRGTDRDDSRQRSSPRREV